MRQIRYLFAALCAILSCCGCALWEENDRGPEPTTVPYQIPVKPAGKSGLGTAQTEHLVNEFVSAISLKMALSAKGPYRIFCAREPSPIGKKVLRGLSSMGLTRISGTDLLYYAEKITREKITLQLGSAPGKQDFYYHTLPYQKEKIIHE